MVISGFQRAARKHRLQCTSAFKASDCSMFLNVPLAREMAKPTFKRQRHREYLLIGGKAESLCKGVCIQRGKEFVDILQFIPDMCHFHAEAVKSLCTFSISLFFCPGDLKACVEITVSYDGGSLQP